MKTFSYRVVKLFAIFPLLISYIILLSPSAKCFSQPALVQTRSETNLAATRDCTVVALTREVGKNDKLMQQIQKDPEVNNQLDLLELPCIEHASGSDYDILKSTLVSKKWDYIAITSPEAAKVLASAWNVIRDDPVSVAAVGKATEKTLEKYGIPVAFVPSKATAKTLAAELELKGEGTSLLYPASAKAKNTLQNGLASRGFEVTRLNTYDTVTAKWSEEEIEAAKRVEIVCFASQSSINGWLHNTGNNKDVMAACIGETSAQACREQNWNESRIFYPENPGMEGWITAIQEARETIIKMPHS